jgi:hypothetical protein
MTHPSTYMYGVDPEELPETADDVPAQDGEGTALGESHGDKSNTARPVSVDTHVKGGRAAGQVVDEALTVDGDESGTVVNSGWNRDISQAPTDGSFVILAIGGKTLKSYWCKPGKTDPAHWCFLTHKQVPEAWMPWPEYPVHSAATLPTEIQNGAEI